jgi:hypothetical protein
VDWLQAEGGVLTFRTPEEALAGLEEVNHHYDFHSQEARAVAEAYFDASRVLPRLLTASLGVAH